ncbi:hypothetical protein EJB05_27575 [Eragrostis curvula]|uniref:Uncharacterized protein n=1 Tax=Eragrostis curvula TaxID=38414 RepID=A0A5J9UNR7_9POAL|nr:hypothetical protein EJB05_27575 [Eragrostis curvula]
MPSSHGHEGTASCCPKDRSLHLENQNTTFESSGSGVLKGKKSASRAPMQVISRRADADVIEADGAVADGSSHASGWSFFEESIAVAAVPCESFSSDLSPPVVADACKGELPVRPVQKQNDALPPHGRTARHDYLVVENQTQLLRRIQNRVLLVIQISALLHTVHEAALAVQEALDVVQRRDGRECELGARERVDEEEVGRLVSCGEPAVGGADQRAAAQRRVRQANPEGGAARRAVERGGAGVVVVDGGVEQARGRVHDGEADAADVGAGGVPRGAEGAGAEQIWDAQRLHHRDQHLRRKAGPIRERRRHGALERNRLLLPAPALEGN